MQFVNGILFGCGLGLGFYLGVSAWGYPAPALK